MRSALALRARPGLALRCLASLAGFVVVWGAVSAAEMGADMSAAASAAKIVGVASLQGNGPTGYGKRDSGGVAQPPPPPPGTPPSLPHLRIPGTVYSTAL